MASMTDVGGSFQGGGDCSTEEGQVGIFCAAKAGTMKGEEEGRCRGSGGESGAHPYGYWDGVRGDTGGIYVAFIATTMGQRKCAKQKKSRLNRPGGRGHS